MTDEVGAPYTLARRHAWYAGYPMLNEPFLMSLVKRIKDEYGDDINHFILMVR